MMSKITRKSLFLAGLSPVFFPVHAQDAKQTPNVIYILADDMGIGDLGCYGQKIIKTPAIDKLAAEGMIFMQHYSGSTVSAPSRCSLMTGKHTGHAAIRGNNGYRAADGEEYDQVMSSREGTVAQLFKEKHYVTACVGKWGLGGPGSVSTPNKMGFDYFFGYLGQGHAHHYYPDFLFENDKKIQLGGKAYSHDLISTKAFDFIDKNAQSPFFLYFAPTIPHADLDIPDLGQYAGKFPEKPFPREGTKSGYKAQPQPKAAYAAMVTRLDEDVRKLVDLLKAKGIYDNTIILFSSDNGSHLEGGNDPDFFDSNGPYRGYKRDLYEGGIHAPLIVSWPQAIHGPAVSYHMSAFWDFLPTVSDLLGLPTPKNTDGISFLPTLTGNGKQAEHGNLYFEFYEDGGRQAVIENGWKLIRLQVDNPAKTRLELFNLQADPGERANVAPQYPERVSKMLEVMQKEHTKNPVWQFKFEK